jgi:hypothetical protein
VATAEEWEWESLDPSEGTDTVVLLGAGASADLGLPTAKRLHALLSEELGPLYRNLAESVFPDGDVDVERLFRVVELVHSIETEGRPAERRSSSEQVDVARLVEKWIPKLDDYLASQSSVRVGTPTGSVIDNLWSSLLRLLWLAPNAQEDSRYLAWMLKSLKGGTVVTINYDNALQWTSTRGVWIPIHGGFLPLDRSRQIPGWPHSKDAVRIVKLHGSLEWARNPHTGEVRLVGLDEIVMRESQRDLVRAEPPAIIFGAGNKLRADGPYLDLYIEAKSHLACTHRLIVIGYGWRDCHVNELVRRWVVGAIQPSLLRVSDFDGRQTPKIIEEWVRANDHVQLDIVEGSAKEQMRALMRPTAGLLS